MRCVREKRSRKVAVRLCDEVCEGEEDPFLAWTSGRIPTKWSLSLPPGGRDCLLPHDSGAGLCWQHVGGVGSTTTTREKRSRKGAVRSCDEVCEGEEE